VVYETHHFGGEAHDDEPGQARFVRATLDRLEVARQDWGVPVFVGEFWLSDFPGLVAEFVSGLERLGISWANWTYKHKNPPEARFPEGITMGPSWALVHDGPDAEPDIDHDDEATIAERWAHHGSAAFRTNDALAAALRTRG
jgi:hypothetical protein